jgi:hypothetical protein
MNLKRFLRYNARHHLYFPRDGKLPQLNPMSSRSHSDAGKRTHSWNELLWLFRLRQRFFCFAGRQRCGRRGDFGDRVFPGRYKGDPLPDTWDVGPDGNRTCSYCGSIHADDLMEICRKTLADERYGVKGTTKSYKVYVKQPGVQNAGQGAIKFYMHHAPEVPSQADRDLFANALRVTRQRQDAQWAARMRTAQG